MTDLQTTQFQQLLSDAIIRQCEDQFGSPAEVATYEEAGILTDDAGLVVEVTDPIGARFQVTIIRVG
jgi:hypothetical protein